MRKKFDEMRKEVHRGAAVITDGGGGCRPEVKGWEACLNKYSVNYALVGGKYSNDNPRTANHARVFFSSGGPSAPGRRFPLKAGEAKVRCTYMARRDVGPRFVTPCSTPHISAGCVPQNRGPTG